MQNAFVSFPNTHPTLVTNDSVSWHPWKDHQQHYPSFLMTICGTIAWVFLLSDPSFLLINYCANSDKVDKSDMVWALCWIPTEVEQNTIAPRNMRRVGSSAFHVGYYVTFMSAPDFNCSTHSIERRLWNKLYKLPHALQSFQLQYITFDNWIGRQRLTERGNVFVYKSGYSPMSLLFFVMA